MLMVWLGCLFVCLFVVFGGLFRVGFLLDLGFMCFVVWVVCGLVVGGGGFGLGGGFVV